jgi:hypothetical protein
MANMKPHRIRRALPLLAMLLVALGLSACSGGTVPLKPVYPVSGKVFYRQQPAPGAVVTFAPAKDPDAKEWPTGYPHAEVQADGSFKVATYGTDDGAPAGEYTVTIVWIAGERDREYDKFKGRYANQQKSKFKVEVKADAGGTVVPSYQLD